MLIVGLHAGVARTSNEVDGTTLGYCVNLKQITRYKQFLDFTDLYNIITFLSHVESSTAVVRGKKICFCYDITGIDVWLFPVISVWGQMISRQSELSSDVFMTFDYCP